MMTEIFVEKCLVLSHGLRKILQPGEITENKWSNE